jgi:hypothetical protein
MKGFYVPASTILRGKDIARENTAILENQERKRRMSVNEQKRARMEARKVSALISQQVSECINNKKLRVLTQDGVFDSFSFQNTSIMEENERKARMADKDSSKQARMNAYKVSRLIKSRNPYRTANKSTSMLSVAPSTISPASRPISVHTRQPKSPVIHTLSRVDTPRPALRTSAKLEPSTNEHLIKYVQDRYKKELMLMEADRKRAEALADKHGLFTQYRVQKHEAAAQKHAANAKAHENWLKRVAPTVAPASPALSANY